MARMTDPGAAFSAIYIATAKVVPPEIPVKTPSFAANLRDHSIPTGPGGSAARARLVGVAARSAA
jgi:hypothetical protein